MTHELILASVAQGLDPNDHGFCPVAADAAISPHIVRYLSALEDYQHLVAQSDKNPIIYSHFILPDRSEHVLSRMAAVGTDDQQQPNVLAHYIILNELELVSEGPAWLLALPGFHFSEWNAPPLQFLQGRPIPTLTNPQSLTRRQQIARQYRWLAPEKIALTGAVDLTSVSYLAEVRSNNDQIALVAPPTTPCPKWQELTGDAGWGGVLTETVFTEQPVVLIYKPGQNILPLFVEALALVPPNFSWRATFCTCFSVLSDTILYQWKGVIAGSEQAKTLTKDLNNLVIDLTVPMGEALMGKYVDFARHGHESMLPLDAEEYTAALINADTKAYGDEENDTGKWEKPPHVPPTNISDTVVPSIPLPKKRAGLFESFLLRSSRFQFYVLYSIMFVMILFLLAFLVDQAGEFGMIQRVQHWNQLSVPALSDDPKPEIASELETEIESESVTEDVLKTFTEAREKQRSQLLLCWKDFDFPPFLPLHFPDVQDDHIVVPEKATFHALSLLQPFGAALELRFVPLFELPDVKVVTQLMRSDLPALVWQVESIDAKTRLDTPVFRFQLTEAGFEIEWQQEGLNNQHLYDTILSSLGFLQLNVADMPETAIQIPLFAPKQTEPVTISALAGRAESETPEYVIELPFASDLWQRIFTEMDPPRVLWLEVWTEPAEDWIQVKPSPGSEFSAEVHTSQQVGMPAEGNETVFENIRIPVVAKASLKKIVWKADDYAGRLRLEEGNLKTTKEDLEKTIEQLRLKAFENDEDARTKRAASESELKTLNFRLKVIENILDKLPEAYKELGQNETKRFHCSLFLESTERERKLLILKTVTNTPDGI